MRWLVYISVAGIAFLGGFLTGEYRTKATSEELSRGFPPPAPQPGLTSGTGAIVPGQSLTAPVRTAPTDGAIGSLSVSSRESAGTRIAETSLIEADIEAAASSLRESGVSEEEIKERVGALHLSLIQGQEDAPTEVDDIPYEQLQEELKANFKEAGIAEEDIERMLKSFSPPRAAKARKAE